MSTVSESVPPAVEAEQPPAAREYHEAWAEALYHAHQLKDALEEMVAFPADGAGLSDEGRSFAFQGATAEDWSEREAWASLYHNTLRGVLFMAEVIRSDLGTPAPGEVEAIVREMDEEHTSDQKAGLALIAEYGELCRSGAPIPEGMKDAVARFIRGYCPEICERLASA